jgi:hypothetical protein
VLNRTATGRRGGYGALPAPREIPFDYTVSFQLEGQPGNPKQQVINISMEGAFVATAISHGLVLPAFEDIGKVTVPDPGPDPGPIINLARMTTSQTLTAAITPQQAILEAQYLSALTDAATNFIFFYSIVDSGTGRELQNDHLLQMAAMGRGDGQRPFRSFPKPIRFLPRSTVRVQVEEIIRSGIFKGAKLWIVLHGYKMLA